MSRTLLTNSSLCILQLFFTYNYQYGTFDDSKRSSSSRRLTEITIWWNILLLPDIRDQNANVIQLVRHLVIFSKH